MLTWDSFSSLPGALGTHRAISLFLPAKVKQNFPQALLQSMMSIPGSISGRLSHFSKIWEAKALFLFSVIFTDSSLSVLAEDTLPAKSGGREKHKTLGAKRTQHEWTQHRGMKRFPLALAIRTSVVLRREVFPWHDGGRQNAAGRELSEA